MDEIASLAKLTSSYKQQAGAAMQSMGSTISSSIAPIKIKPRPFNITSSFSGFDFDFDFKVREKKKKEGENSYDRCRTRFE